MAILRQLLLSLAVIAGALWAIAVYVPAAEPWFTRGGVYDLLGVTPPSERASQAAQPKGDAARPPTAVMAVAVVMDQLTDEVAAIGDGRAWRSVSVRSDVAGRVAEVQIASGQRVEAGDVLIRLDDDGERIALERARLTLADAEAEMARVIALAGTGAVSGVRRSSAELAEKAALLSVRQAEFDLSQKVIRAPISGWAGLLNLEVGDRITNQEVLAVLTDRSRILVEFRVPERLTGQVQAGVEFQAEPLALRGTLLTGRVVAVDNVIDRASRTLRVQGELSNGDDALRAGMAFAVQMRFAGLEYPSVPSLAVQWSTDGAFVWAVTEGKARRVPVTILRRAANSVLVSGALAAGDMIVVEGVQNLRPGVPVEYRRAESAASGPGPDDKAKL